MAAEVTRLRTAPTRTLCTDAEAFLDTIGSANTRRAYGIAIVKTVDQLDGRGPDGLIGAGRALDSVTDAEVGAALETLWGSAVVNTWDAATPDPIHPASPQAHAVAVSAGAGRSPDYRRPIEMFLGGDPESPTGSITDATEVAVPQSCSECMPIPRRTR